MAATCPVRPILPRAPGLLRVGFVTGRASRDLPVRQRLELADPHRGQLDTRIARQVHGKPDDVDERSCHRGESVAPHQRDVVVAKATRQIAPLCQVRDQKVRIPEIVGNVPDRHISPDETSGVDDRPQRNVRDSEGQTVLGMSVHHRLSLWARFVNSTVDESFNRRRAGVANRFTIQAEFHNVAALDHFRGSEHLTHEKPLRLAGMANTDVTIRIDYVLVGKYPVGDHEFVKGFIQSDHHFSSEAYFKANRWICP